MEDEMKRTSDFNCLPDFERKKFKREFNDKHTPITCIENLSNELFYEIFDYLDIFDIYEIFPNLNNRFKCLVTSSLFLLKVKLSSNSNTNLEHFCKQIITPNRHRIISLHLWDRKLVNDFFSQYMINSSFIHLKSIVLHGISQYRLLIILFYLRSLPELCSLTISLDEQFDEDLDNIYHMILHLSKLQYLKISLPEGMDSNYFSLVPVNEHFSTLRYLVIDQSFTMNSLMSILYRLPHLWHLTVRHLIKSEENVKNEFTLKPPTCNLKYFCIQGCEMEFDDFETFMKNVSFHMRRFRISIDWNITYFDANRWEKLIANHMPNLNTFNFILTDAISDDDDDDDDFDYIHFNVSINQFTSSFWIERGWYFSFEIDTDRGVYICSIHPYKKQWLDLWYHTKTIISRQQQDDKISIPFDSSIQLSIINHNSVEWNESFIEKLKPICSTIRFISLKLDSKHISIRMWMETFRMLPHLDSLELSAVSLPKLNKLSNEDAKILPLISNYNKITKINLKNLINFDQIHFLLTICPCIQHLQVSFEYDNNFMKIIELILTKTTKNPDFRSLCLYISCINKKMIHPIQSMIDYQKLLTNYTIKYIPDHIILQWK